MVVVLLLFEAAGGREVVFKAATRGGYGLTTALTCLFDAAFNGVFAEFLAVVVLTAFSPFSTTSCSSITDFASGKTLFEADVATLSPSGGGSVYITA